MIIHVNIYICTVYLRNIYIYTRMVVVCWNIVLNFQPRKLVRWFNLTRRVFQIGLKLATSIPTSCKRTKFDHTQAICIPWGEWDTKNDRLVLFWTKCVSMQQLARPIRVCGIFDGYLPSQIVASDGCLVTSPGDITPLPNPESDSFFKFSRYFKKEYFTQIWWNSWTYIYIHSVYIYIYVYIT